MQYLPLGYKPQTPEQLQEQEARFKRYDYYGIPYGIIDDPEDEEITQIEIDQVEAVTLILQGKEIPKDLEQRLLSYKHHTTQ